MTKRRKRLMQEVVEAARDLLALDTIEALSAQSSENDARDDTRAFRRYSAAEILAERLRALSDAEPSKPLSTNRLLMRLRALKADQMLH